MPNLRNCPFCGGHAHQRQVPGSFGGYNLTEIACRNCGATATDAETWNRRDYEEWPPGHETIFKKEIIRNQEGDPVDEEAIYDLDRLAVAFGGPKCGGKTGTSFIVMLEDIDPKLAQAFRDALNEAMKDKEGDGQHEEDE